VRASIRDRCTWKKAIHQTLGLTPAMKAGVSDRDWSIDEVIALL
jgi:hypothetical protein